MCPTIYSPLPPNPVTSMGHPCIFLSEIPADGLLLSLLGFPSPNYHTLYFGVYRIFHHPHLLSSFLWAPLAHFYLPSISHGITISFFRLFWSHLLSLRPFYYSTGLQTIIPAIQAAWFSSQFAKSSSLFYLILLGFFLLLGLPTRMGINKSLTKKLVVT